jgi:hypothetical protein
VIDWLECRSDWDDNYEPLDFLSPKDKAAFESLPKHIRIYRGCSLPRVYGFAWTTDLLVAERFAKGHRGVGVPDPVIASFRVPKAAIIGYYTDREESEAFIEPRIIENYSVTIKSVLKPYSD